MKVVSVEAMRKIEAAADASGISYAEMMENAGEAVALRVIAILAQLPDPSEARVTLLIGPGNNGGDGLVAGRVIAEQIGALVRFYLLTRRPDDDPHMKAIEERGLFVAHAEDDQRFRVLTNMVASAHVVVDALFGIGLTLPLRDNAAKLLRAAKQALDEGDETGAGRPIQLASPAPRPATHPYVIAVDCPSGLDCDTGKLDKNALNADETVTFIAAKPGLFTFPGAAAVGALTITSAGVPGSTEGLKEAQHSVVDPASVRALLPARPADGNKGTFGKVLILGGSANYVGAPGMAARAAYRSGVGLVAVGAPEPTVAALAGHLLETIWLLFPHEMGALSADAAPYVREEAAKYSALLVGPGWGREKTTRELLLKLLDDETTRPMRRVIGFSVSADAEKPEAGSLPPLVIDADGLNLLSEIDEWWTHLPAGTILTPHPGEMARLAGTDVQDVQSRRWEIAEEKAKAWNVVLVLKGAHTLVAAPDGRVAALPFKTSALAHAGTGDVLAGLTAGMLAQGLSPFDAAVAAGYVHGLAGERAAFRLGSERSVLAGDVIEAIPDAFRVLG
ncbi:MAG: NAD(P)H-hydrate dehydratase [Anaerolineae bacterium]|nr:NAD(P)H-hydrate dehydratase [Anaerolineae bacterium]